MTVVEQLTWEAALAHAERGDPVEQWISFRVEKGFRFIKWIRIERLQEDSWGLWDKECLDTGSEEECDISEFLNLDYDNPEGKLTEFNGAEEALLFGCEQCGGDKMRFVKGGDLQEVYRDFVRQHGKAEKGINEWY